jgi:pyrimidine operon attenuation protein/uracil phosphoribosyltransferase
MKVPVARKLERMALEIIENNIEEEELILIGIRENGSIIAKDHTGSSREVVCS